MTLVLVFKNKNDVAPATGAKNDEPRTLRLVRVGDYRHGGGAELYERLKPDRCLYVMVSSDSDLDQFGWLTVRYQW